MEWLVLGSSALVTGLAVPSTSVPHPSLGTHTIFAVSGLVAMIVFVAGGAATFAWIALGLACAGPIACAAGARTLVLGDAATLQGFGRAARRPPRACSGSGCRSLPSPRF
jgi:hypothetical protein